MAIVVIVVATIDVKKVGRLEGVPIIRQVQDGYYTGGTDATDDIDIGLKKNGFNIAFAIGQIGPDVDD
jgi:hypothetical protein